MSTFSQRLRQVADDIDDRIGTFGGDDSVCRLQTDDIRQIATEIEQAVARENERRANLTPVNPTPKS